MFMMTHSVIVLFALVGEIRALKLTNPASRTPPTRVSSTTKKVDEIEKSYSDDFKIGRLVHFGEYKWVVAVYHSEFEFPKCTGIILTEQSVMTSCTCVTEQENKSYAFPDTTKTLMVIAGNPDADNPFHESRTVQKIKIHPYCAQEWIGTRADLAILELNKSFKTQFYEHVQIVPRYSGQPNREAMRDELENFMNTKVTCDVITFGYYDREKRPDKKYYFEKNHTMRAIRAIIVQPSDACRNTCPTPKRCVYDYYNREAICVSGIEQDIGVCGILPGSPIYCMGNFWGIYTGVRNCTVPRAAAIPTVLGFTKFFEGKDYGEDEYSNDPSSSQCNGPSTLQFGLLLLFLYSHNFKVN